MNPKVSVIVPVYKVEDCIERCLDSLCRQSLSDIEIIVVDDASPDGCGEICERYAIRNKQIRVFHHSENRGLSAARNNGIKKATGKYLMFVDSDDWVHDDFCKDAYECAEHNRSDLIMFNYVRIKNLGEVVEHHPNAFHNLSEGLKTKKEALDAILEDGGNPAWNKLYRKELFEDISYPDGFLYEDTGATYKLTFKASRFYYMDKVLYYHCFHPGSITTLKTKKVLSDRAKLNSQRYRDLLAEGYNSEILDYRIKDFALWYLIRKKKDMSDSDYLFYYNILKNSRCIPNRFSRNKVLQYFFFKYFPSIFDWYYTIKGCKI